MIIYSESVIEAIKENEKRQIAAQIKRSNQFREAREHRSKNRKQEASLLKGIRQQLSQANPRQIYRQAKLAGQES